MSSMTQDQQRLYERCLAKHDLSQFHRLGLKIGPSAEIHDLSHQPRGVLGLVEDVLKVFFHVRGQSVMGLEHLCGEHDTCQGVVKGLYKIDAFAIINNGVIYHSIS